MFDCEMTEAEIYAIAWNIQRKSRDWTTEEVRPRYNLRANKIELINGKIFCSEEERLVMLALLLENVGMDKVVRLGDPNIWREAIAQLPDK